MKNIIRINNLFVVVLLICGLNACKETPIIDTYEVKLPVITDFYPKSGGIGTEITITGENLQQVDAVYIGEGLAEIKSKISGNQMVVTVTNSTRSGILAVSNLKGKAELADVSFTITYVAPTITSCPSEGIVNKDIILEGGNLNVVDHILLGDTRVTVISQRKNEIVFKVPFFETEDPVLLKLVYFDGEGEAFVGPEGETFVVLKEAPSITDIPESLTKYTPVVIRGETLTLVDKIVIGGIEALIVYQNDTEITFDMPTDYFGGNMSGILKAIYYDTRELILANDFHVYADTNEPRYYTHKNVLLSARVGYGGTEDAFFDAETGIAYHSCAAFDHRKDIDFFLYDQVGYVQLYGPKGSLSVVKNYKCENKTIDVNDGSWNDFYGGGEENGIETKFKVLSQDLPKDKSIIDAFEASTLIELNDALFTNAGISMPATSSPRIYRSTGDSGYNLSSGHFAVDKNNYGWVKNYTTGKNGIIKVTGVPKDPVGGRMSELTFDIIWEK